MKKLKALVGVLLFAAVAYGATTYTINYNLARPGDGDRNYGSLIRTNFDKIDSQMKINQDSVTNHLADAIGSHAATSISTTPGVNICTTQTDVQEYLTCLDSLLDPSASGVVLVTGAQTITGLKTFSVAPVLPSVPSGILSTDPTGVISATDFGGLSPLTTKGDLLVFGAAVDRLGIGTDGQQLVADSAQAEGMKWQEPNPKWRKFTIPFGDFSSASNSFGITLFSLQAGEGIDAVIIKHNTAFSGGASTGYSIQVGLASNIDKYASAFDVFQAVSPTLSSVNNGVDVPNFGVTSGVVVTAVSSGDTLDNVTTGSVDVFIRTFLLP